MMPLPRYKSMNTESSSWSHGAEVTCTLQGQYHMQARATLHSLAPLHTPQTTQQNCRVQQSRGADGQQQQHVTYMWPKEAVRSKPLKSGFSRMCSSPVLPMMMMSFAVIDIASGFQGRRERRQQPGGPAAAACAPFASAGQAPPRPYSLEHPLPAPLCLDAHALGFAFSIRLRRSTNAVT